MKKFKNFAFGIIFAFVSIFAITACGKKKNTTSQKATTNIKTTNKTTTSKVTTEKVTNKVTTASKKTTTDTTTSKVTTEKVTTSKVTTEKTTTSKVTTEKVTTKKVTTAPHVHSFETELSYDDEYHYYNSTCGHNVVDGKELHDLVETIVKEATKTEKGIKRYSCKKCAYTKDVETDKLPLDEYTITWVVDGYVVKEEEVTEGIVPSFGTTDPTMDKDKYYTYSFTGWSPEVTAVTEDATYTANFVSEDRIYTVYWYNSDTLIKTTQQSFVNDEFVYDGENPSIPENEAATYYFIGWTYTSGPNEDEYTLRSYYGYVTKEYDITWADGNGDTLYVEKVMYGLKPSFDSSKCSTPEKAFTDTHYYTFNGNWEPEITKVTGNTTYTAQFDEYEHFKVTYDTGTNKTIATEYIPKGGYLVDPCLAIGELSKYGYNNDGWYCNDSMYNFSSPVTGKLELYIKWSPRAVYFSSETKAEDIEGLDNSCGSVSYSGDEKFGSTITITAEPYVGFEFDRWEVPACSFNSTDITTSFEITTITLFKITAYFKPITYTYNISSTATSYGYSGSMSFSIVRGTEKLPVLNAYTAKKSGYDVEYEFVGWANSTTDETIADNEGNIVSFDTDKTIEVKPVFKEAYVYLGTYPQTLITDTTLQQKIHDKVMESGGNFLRFFYKENDYDAIVDTNMDYADVTVDGIKYRLISIKEYRPMSVGGEVDEFTVYQQTYGFEKNNIYYFRFDPIKWKILSINPNTNEVLLASDIVLDSQPFNFFTDEEQRTLTNYCGKTENVYGSNYEFSFIRKWLNVDFYNVAFSSSEQSVINTTTVYNDDASTLTYRGSKKYYYVGDNGNSYNTCSDTEDKVFLLSASEVAYFVKDHGIGFSPYAVSQGLKTIGNSDSNNYPSSYASYDFPASLWMLRSAHPELRHKNLTCYHTRVMSNCDANVENIRDQITSSTYQGVRPAIKITLS